MTVRPVPVPDEQSAPYWAATADHVLAIARCTSCGTYNHPPGRRCRNCRSTEPFAFTPVSGRGAVRSWTIVRQALLPGFEELVPYMVVDVELEEQTGLRITGRLLDGPDAPVRLEAPVQVAFEDIADGVSIPAFVLA